MPTRLKTLTDPDGFSHPYPAIYYGDRADATGNLFIGVSDYVEGIDTCQFIRDYLSSQERAYGDSGSAHHLALFSDEMRRNLQERGYNYPKGRTIFGDFNYWAGLIYTYMQWKYDVPSAELVRLIDPRELHMRYPGLHCMPLQGAGEKLCYIYDIAPERQIDAE